MLALRLTLFSVAAVLRTAINAASSGPAPGALDFSAPDNSALLALLMED